MRSSPLRFAPATLTVSAGSTVVWFNATGGTHTVTSSDGELDSGSIASGNTFSHEFVDAGTYDYFCAFHGSMQATVVVER